VPTFEEGRQVLETFITSPELVKLETRFARFNVFEALGVARRELHHSSFLAFLLNPQESHGLRDLFLRRFLQEVAKLAPEPTVSAIEIDGLDLLRTEVRREYQNIDILLRDPLNEILVVIENKVGSTQHDDQLKRYYDLATERFQKHRFMGIYLTPEGDDSNDQNYISLSYDKIRELVSDLLGREDLLISPNFRSVLEQYGDLLDRRFMADQKLQELCASIYKRHKLAIDILRANLPDEHSGALLIVKNLAADTKFIVDKSDHNSVRFIPESFKISAFESETAWLESGQMVYAEFRRKGEDLVFQVRMDGGSPDERARVHKFAQVSQPPFKVDKAVYAKYQVLYSQIAVEGSVLSTMDEQTIANTVKDKWNEFLGTIRLVSAAINNYSW